MRLTSLTVTNYGVFQSTRIDFDPAPGRINLLIAPNGAGKSILRNAFCDLLFGIGGQTPMGFRYGYPNMRLTAEAVTPDGAFVFGRRKGKGNTLIDADGNALDGATIGRLLGRADLGLLERLFALDTERLRAGGQALLASGGELADALLSAAGGLRDAREVRRKLEEARDLLAPERRAKTRPFYVALDEWRDAQARVGKTALKPETRQKQELALTALHNEQALQAKLHKQAARRLARLERVRRVRGLLAALDEQAAWLAAHPEAPALPIDAGTRLDAAERLLRDAEQAREHTRATRDAIAAQSAEVNVDAALIEAAAEVEVLVRRAGAMQKAEADRPARQGEQDAAAGRVDAILRQLGAKEGDAIPPLPAITRARQLLSRHDSLRADLDRLPRERATKTEELAKAAAELAELGPFADTHGLHRLTRQIGVDPAARASEAARTVAQRRAALEQTLRGVPDWIGGAEALADLRPLPPMEYERLSARLGTAEHARARLSEELSAARDAAEQATAGLAELSDDGPIPDKAAVRSARQARDIGWRLICRRIFEDAPDPDGERAWADDLPLGLAYERAVTAADHLADRRGDRAQDVEHAAELRRALAAAGTAIGEKTEGLAEAERASADARAAWATGLATLGLSDYAGLSAVREMVGGRERAIDALRDLSTAGEAHAELLARHALWAGQLASMMNEPMTDDPAALPVLLAHADDAIELATRTEKRRIRLETSRAALSQDVEQRDRDWTEASGRQAHWQAEWAAALTALGRPADEHPDVTRVLLDSLTDLDKEQQSACQLGQRLRDMHRDMEAFRADMAAAAHLLASDIADADAFEIVRALQRRLTEQQKAAQKRDTLQTQLEDADRKLAARDDELTRTGRELRAALEAVGAETTEAARARISLAMQRRLAEEAHREAERELRDKGDGLDIEALRAEAAGVAPDDLAEEKDAAERDREATVAILQDLAARIATAGNELDRQERETGAEAAAAEQEAAAARLGRVLDEATLLHLAASMLDTALGAVGSAGSPAVLGRIGTLFRVLTDGAYDGIAAEAAEDGSAQLVARERGFPDEAKHIAQLSEGTRDQLFLALRIAAIEDQAAGAPSLPFIGDDILQTFDDDRAEAAMRALVELSQTTQVILLSHHRHLRDIATRLDGCVHVCAAVLAG